MHLLSSVTVNFDFLGTCTMSQVGKLEEFDVTTCEVDTYIERLDCYFVANNIPDTAKVSTFISLAGPKTYKLLKSLVSPDKVSNKMVDELKQILKTHVQPMESLMSRRAKFYSRKQRVYHRLCCGSQIAGCRREIRKCFE